MKLVIKKGTTSKRVAINVADASKTDGSGLAGLLFNSSGLLWYYWREDEGNAAATAVTLATATRGTFASGGFIEKDATNFVGAYEIGIPNAALATGANWVTMMLFGAANMVPVRIEIELVDYDPTDGVRLGLTALPAAPMDVKKNQALAAFTFFMADSADHVTGKTGLTVAVQRSIDGAAFGNATNTPATEISAGWYKIDLSAADLNGKVIAIKCTSAGADPTPFTLITQT